MIKKIKYIVPILLIILVVVFAICIITNKSTNSDEEQPTEEISGEIEDTTEETVSYEVSETDEVLYNEGEADHNYNYITNAYFINDAYPNISWEVYLKIGDKLDSELQSMGYTQRQLTCTKAYMEGTSSYLQLWFDISDEPDKQLYVNYLYPIDSWKEISLIDK